MRIRINVLFAVWVLIIFVMIIFITAVNEQELRKERERRFQKKWEKKLLRAAKKSLKNQRRLSS